jgi:uroporphyrin-III C-methyltransferase
MGSGKEDILYTPRLQRQPIEGGMSKKTPVAVIENGTTPNHKMITGDLSNISKLASQKHIKPPSIIIIGKVVGLSKTLQWRDKND